MIPAPIFLERLALERVHDRRHEADDRRRLRDAEHPVTPARFTWLAPWRRWPARAEQVTAGEDRGERRCAVCSGLASGGAH